MISPRWDWEFLDAAGTLARVAPSPAFVSRYAAEEWLGGTWRALAAGGVARAVLRHDGARLDGVDLTAAARAPRARARSTSQDG